MTCQEFLARHSEYLDLAMDPLEAAFWREHAENCPSCSHYDRVLRRGVHVLRDLPEIEPSESFFSRFEHRLYDLQEEARAGGRASGAGTALSLAIAATLALLSWAPLLRSGQLDLLHWSASEEELAVAERAAGGPAARRPATAPRSVPRAVQLAAEAADLDPGAGWPDALAGGGGDAMLGLPAAWWWSETGGPAQVRQAGAFQPIRTTELHVPGPYSPLVVGAPTFRAATMVRRYGATAGRD